LKLIWWKIKKKIRSKDNKKLNVDTNKAILLSSTILALCPCETEKIGLHNRMNIPNNGNKSKVNNIIFYKKKEIS